MEGKGRRSRGGQREHWERARILEGDVQSLRLDI